MTRNEKSEINWEIWKRAGAHETMVWNLRYYWQKTAFMSDNAVLSLTWRKAYTEVGHVLDVLSGENESNVSHEAEEWVVLLRLVHGGNLVSKATKMNVVGERVLCQMIRYYVRLLLSESSSNITYPVFGMAFHKYVHDKKCTHPQKSSDTTTDPQRLANV